MESRIFSIKLRLLWIISCDRGSSTSALLSGSGALRASVAMEQRMAKTARGENIYEKINQNVTAEASEREKSPLCIQRKVCVSLRVRGGHRRGWLSPQQLLCAAAPAGETAAWAETLSPKVTTADNTNMSTCTFYMRPETAPDALNSTLLGGLKKKKKEMPPTDWSRLFSLSFWCGLEMISIEENAAFHKHYLTTTHQSGCAWPLFNNLFKYWPQVNTIRDL